MSSQSETTAHRPCRLIFWGPGHVGGTAMRVALRRPDFDVVGALVYSADNDGRDVGELVGLPPVGVAATTSVEQILALDADVVLHSPQPALDESEMIDQVVALLESGKNVVSVTSFFYPRMRGREIEKRLEDACATGGSSLHGTGIHPSLMLERFAPTLTAMVDEVRHIQLTEVVDCEYMLAASPIALAIVGWGFDTDQISPQTPGGMIPDRMYRDSIGYLGKLLYNAEPEDIRIERDYRSIPADKRCVVGPLTIEPGQAITVIHHHEGWIGDHKFCTTQEFWYLGRDNHPFPELSGESNYILDVQGSPADLHMQFAATSNAGDGLPVTTHITAIPLLQAAVPVAKAAPGIVYQRSGPHWASDLRTVEAMVPGLPGG
jgi:4-hydroxy-tetrahydrodipicolinate reductase